MMWGKHYGSMYEGSMVGSGSAVFAVWGYVISKMAADAEVGAQVDLNPALLAFVIGEDEPVIEAAITKLCEPDPKSRTAEKEGRRLVRLGQFAYQVVNGVKYLGMRDLEAKRAADRQRKAKSRGSKKITPMGAGSVNAAGRKYEKELSNGASEEALDKIVTDSLPPELREEPVPYRVEVPLPTPERCAEMIEKNDPATFFEKVSVGENLGEVIQCERCGESGHIGNDCPLPMHLEGGKWVRD